MSVEFLNCTPHEIILFEGDNKRAFMPSGKILRVTSKEQTELPFQHLGVPVVTKQTFDSVEGSVDIPDGAHILVSMPVGEKLAMKPETVKWWVFGPDTGPDAVVRDGAGKIRGTTRFILYAVPHWTKYDCPICGEEKMPRGYCLSCGTDLTEECCHVDGTSLHIVDRKLERRPKKTMK